ncbi:MAG: serine hydroxymethyltransferase [Candidatus Thorarchaeota archaeon]|nr:MAG: serine hydroxymethyltransferase [Candidatus Thorarchaeota archaeon]RLI59693.1 MAG: serine hydroxymethyltransferase [Candidatus Thorarchaeota archaeon]
MWMSEHKKLYDQVFDLIERHDKWMSNTINLIASENVSSPAVRSAIVSDFRDRYAEGWPGERVYAGCKYIDQVELITIDLAKKLYKADFADVRPVSGVVANLAMYTAAMAPLDRMMALSIAHGGHISHARRNLGGTAGAIRGHKVQNWVFDDKEFNIDVDASIARIRKLQEKGDEIKFLLFGASVFPFPHPVKEFREIADEYNMIIGYDSAHVSGLIASGFFQDPLREGADMMTASTHKTMPGPQHGIVLAREEFADAIKRASFPGLLSNHHLHNVAGLAVVLAEMTEFGVPYSKQILKNAKALAQALHERGWHVIAEHKGFTESHVVLVDVTETPMKDGRTVEETLEDANIVINRNLLPWDKKRGRDYKTPGGIRLGTSEMTRLGMKESEMDAIAEFMTRVVMKGEDVKKIASEIGEFRKEYQKVHYAFDTETPAYAHLRFM